MKKNLIAILLVIAMVFSFAACGSNDTGNDVEQDATTNNGLSRIVKIAIYTDVLSLDPQGHNGLMNSHVTRMMYDTLIGCDENNEFYPMLAESYQFLDKNTFEIKLRANVPFHNGEIMTAEDVKYSLERASESSYSSHLLTMVNGIEVIDELTLQLDVADESAALISSLAHQCTGIVPKAHTEALEAEGKTLSDDPVGTGPYMYDFWQIGNDCQILRFADYWDEENVAKNEGLYFQYIAENSSRTIALETKTADIIFGVPVTDIPRLESNADVTIHEYESCDLHYISLNSSAEPFNNPLLRKAVAHCIDRNAIIQVVKNGYAYPAYAPIGNAAIGHSDPETIYEYDIEKAKALLKEAGYENGFEFTLLVNGDDWTRTGQIVQAECKKAGITVNLETLEYSALADKAGKAEHQASSDNWTANSEPDNTYSPWFTRDLIGAGGYNWSCYEGPEIEDLMNKARGTNEMSERLGYYAEINEFVSANSLVIPVYSNKGIVATSANLEGLETRPTDLHLFQNITINE